MTASWPPAAQSWPGLVPQRPLGVGEILGLALRLAWVNRRVLLPVALVGSMLATGTVLAGQAAAGTLRSSADGSLLADLQRRAQLGLTVPASTLWALLLPLLLALMISTVIGPLMAGVATPLAAHATTSRDAAGGNLSRLRGRVGILLGCAVLTALAVFGGLLIFVIPGLVAAAALQPVGAVAAMEGLTVTQSLARTARLTSGSRWRIVGVVALAGLVGAALALVASGLITSIMGSAGGVGQYVLTQLIGGLVGAVALCWSGMVTALIYIDLRMRKDGLAQALARVSYPS